jgi:hypothetical protein
MILLVVVVVVVLLFPGCRWNYVVFVAFLEWPRLDVVPRVVVDYDYLLDDP